MFVSFSIGEHILKDTAERDQRLTLYLDNNFREKIKERKGESVEGKDVKRNEWEIFLFVKEGREGKEKEKKGDKSFPFKSFQL